MKEPCKNHPEKAAVVRGQCQACYMRERRAAKRAAYQAEYDADQAAGRKSLGGVASRNGRAAAGHGVRELLRLWSDDVQDALEGRIDDSGECHEWLGTRGRGGYGHFSAAGYTVLAHRLVHAMVTGDVAAEVVMHSCDNPACVNPAHLRSGTYAENMADMRAKGRGASPKAEHLRDRATHPRSRPVLTPSGGFPSATLAAEALGMHPRRVARYCAEGAPGWSYEPKK